MKRLNSELEKLRRLLRHIDNKVRKQVNGEDVKLCVEDYIFKIQLNVKMEEEDVKSN
jgi:hypothetical protein